MVSCSCETPSDAQVVMDEVKKHSLIVLTTLCAIIFQVNARLHPTVPSFEKEIQGELSLDAKSLFRDKTGIYYATKNTTWGPTGIISRSYVVTQEMPITKDFVYKKSCEVNKRDDTNNNIFVPLNRDTVLMVLHSHEYKNLERIVFTSVDIFVVQMNTCQVSQVSLYNITSMAQVYASYDNHFDVLYTTTNFTEGIDCQKHVCRVRFDQNGVQVDGPRQHMKRPDVKPNTIIEYLVPLRVSQTPKSPSLHYSICMQENNSAGKIINESNQMVNFNNFLGVKLVEPWMYYERITKVDANGVSTNLLIRNNFIANFSQISYVNDGISLCYLGHESLICQQYDFEARLKMNVSLKLSDYYIDPHNVLYIPYNLPEDRGMILSIAEIKWEVSSDEYRYKIEKYKIMAITPQGGPKFPIEIDNRNQSLTCSSVGTTRLFDMPALNVVVDGSDICLQVFCSTDHLNLKNRRYQTKCFPKYLLGV